MSTREKKCHTGVVKFPTKNMHCNIYFGTYTLVSLHDGLIPNTYAV